MRNPFKSGSKIHRRSQSVDVHGAGDDQDYQGNSRFAGIETEPRKSGSYLPQIPRQPDLIDDDTVNRVLRHTRGQQGPVVRGMDEPDTYGGYGLNEKPRLSMSGRMSLDEVTREPVSPIPRKSIDETKMISSRRSMDDAGQSRNIPSGSAYGVNSNSRSIPRKSVDSARRPIPSGFVEPGTTGNAYSSSSPMSPAVGSSVIPPRKAVNRDSIIDQDTPMPDARRSMDSFGNSSKPTITSKGLPTYVSKSSPRHSVDDTRSPVQRPINNNDQYTSGSSNITNMNPAYAGISNNNNNNNMYPPRKSSIDSGVLPSRVATDQAVVIPRKAVIDQNRLPVTRESNSSATSPITAGRIATNNNTTMAKDNLQRDSMSIAGPAFMTSNSSNTGSRRSIKRESIGGDIEMGSPIVSDYITLPITKEPSWPLLETPRDPTDTRVSRGPGEIIVDGPLVVPLAQKYPPQPDKFSSTVHVHKEETKINPPVVHERVQRLVREIITEEITRDIHTHEIRVHVQPILDSQRLPDRHWVQDEDGELIEITEQMVNILKLHDGYREVERYEERIDYKGNRFLTKSSPGGKLVGNQIGRAS